MLSFQLKSRRDRNAVLLCLAATTDIEQRLEVADDDLMDGSVFKDRIQGQELMASFRRFRHPVASSKELLRFWSVINKQRLVNRIIDVICLALYQTLQRTLCHFQARLAILCLEYSRDLILKNLSPECKFQDLVEVLDQHLSIPA